MQDEHFMRLWVEGHRFPPTSGAATKAYELSLASHTPLPGARVRLARLLAWAIPAGVLAGIAAATLAGAPIRAGASPTALADTARFDLPYAA